MAVFCPQYVLWPSSDQYCSAAAVGSVVDIVGPLSLWLSSPPEEASSVFISCICFSLFRVSLFFPIFLLFFLSPTRSLPLSHHIHTDRVNKFLLFHPTVSHFHYKTEWIWTAAWITSPHLAFIHFPEGSQRASFFLSAAVIVWADWLYRGCRVRMISGWRPFRTTHSLLLFLIWSHTCLTG